MHLLLIGLSHRVAQVELREKAALDRAQVASVLGLLQARPEVSGSFVLATCGRTEVYVSGPHLSGLATAGSAVLEGIHPEGYPQYAGSLYRHADRAAAEHLFRVAAGLDSLLVGESEVLGQVRAALQIARSVTSLDSVMGGTIDRAIAAARRARRESGLGRRPPSVATAAVSYLDRAGPTLRKSTVIMVGSGEVGEAVAAQLAGRVADLVVVSRTFSKAAALAARHAAQVDDIARLDQLLIGADLAVFAASASEPLLLPAQLTPRTERPLTILDLAVPRNVGPEVGGIPGVTLIGVDELSSRGEPGESGAEPARESAERVLSAEFESWSRWVAMEGLGPRLAEIAHYADGIRQAEVDRALRGLDLDPRTRRRLETLSRALVSKLLIHPISYLRANPEDEAAAELIERIFSRPPESRWS